MCIYNYYINIISCMYTMIGLQLETFQSPSDKSNRCCPPVCSIGDVPASNFLGGFKERVGFALRKCRMCLAYQN